VLEYIDGVIVSKERLGAGKSALKTVGNVRGFTAWDYLGDIEKGTFKVKENSSLKGLVNLIKAKRIDGIYFNVFVARYYLKHTLFDENSLMFDDTLPHSRSHYHVTSIKHPHVIVEIDEFIVNNSELIQALKEKYEVNL